MNLPIYSNLKAKLESKGLDSITSGQIAWFVCSVGVVYLFSMILYLYGVNREGIPLDKIFIAFYINHFFCFIFMWIIFFLNCLHKVNCIPLLLAILQTWLWFYSPYSAYIIFPIICLILYKIKKRLFYTHFVSIFYIFILYYVFELRGGFYK